MEAKRNLVAGAMAAATIAAFGVTAIAGQRPSAPPSGVRQAVDDGADGRRQAGPAGHLDQRDDHAGRAAADASPTSC